MERPVTLTEFDLRFEKARSFALGMVAGGETDWHAIVDKAATVIGVPDGVTHGVLWELEDAKVVGQNLDGSLYLNIVPRTAPPIEQEASAAA